MNVVKMTLAKRAAENIGLESLTEYFSGPTGVGKTEISKQAEVQNFLEKVNFSENNMVDEEMDLISDNFTFDKNSASILIYYASQVISNVKYYFPMLLF